ncbi:MAG: hypothetical protein LBI33_09160 [Propionibacteriaceae bacterium]|jgi:hypothetical protein|nr:hypothetical protein [Propionibacteriaceae bacterium]
MMDALSIRTIIMLVGGGALVIGAGLALLIGKGTKARFLRAHPDAAAIYVMGLAQAGHVEHVALTMIDGHRPHKFFFARVSGVYATPGRHQAGVRYSVWAAGASRPEVRHQFAMPVEVEPFGRHLLVFASGGTGPYSLLRLPSANQVDERSLMTFLHEEAERGGYVTAAAIQQRFG